MKSTSLRWDVTIFSTNFCTLSFDIYCHSSFYYTRSRYDILTCLELNMLKLTGNLEQQVMNILWNAEGALKPAEVQSQIDGPLAYTTVMTILKRLYKKGILQRERDGNAFKYSPKVSKDEYAGSTLEKVYKGILSAYGPLAISHFIDSVNSDPQHRDLLKKYLDENSKDE